MALAEIVGSNAISNSPNAVRVSPECQEIVGPRISNYASPWLVENKSRHVTNAGPSSPKLDMSRA